ncbi:MAG: GNAT family N-acetyltransferase [Anaerolineae bacterium]|nr:GNAT family N-acetyltransferase [Anaerolineae bacterium]
MTEVHTELSFWNLRDERDYPLLLGLNRSSREADHAAGTGAPDPITLEQIAEVLAAMDGLSAQQGVIIAAQAGEAIGYSRLGWYSSRPQTRLYYQISFLRPEKRFLWSALIAENERRLREIASGHAPVSERYFQAWASEHQEAWKIALESMDYQVTRRFNNMLHPLDAVSSRPLPSGLEIRPILPEHMHQIWEAQREFNAGLFENVAEDWLEEKYPTWLANPENQPAFWQVAWDGDRLAGMMLARLDEGPALDSAQGKRGHTEHIYVRPQWRGRGLASALIAHSLQLLKAQGATEVELGVDAENESAAFRLYERLGYRTFSVDIWYRKRMVD